MSGRRGRGGKKGAARRNDNNRIYTHPLPILFDFERVQSSCAARSTTSFLGLFGLTTVRLKTPHIEGKFDVPTRSIWIKDSVNAMLLWRRGFFGKGSLSRSEPSWLARQVNQRNAKAAGKMTAEEVTAKRRAERQQFKLDRARALAEAAREAETVFASTGVVLAESSVIIPSSNTWKPVEMNREVGIVDAEPLGSFKQPDCSDEEELIDLEHLQLTLQEAFFLIWAMDCLSVFNPDADTALSLSQVWQAFQAVQHPGFFESPSLEASPCRFDNPFLVNYVVYHHYRSLGWVVRGGIKFCVDYLLYKRGPVFSHAEFALVVCPVYEDPTDKESSPYDLQNVDPFSWSWLSTVNRTNSQVLKTLILIYVTIPAMSRLSADLLTSPACLAHYTIREIVVRRFIPARMRD